ncbi:hypothetical protein LTR84_001863 [Exophiala bonariae]|uniref:Heme-binding protein n=1 Tax=Exophiala bonariae TaxID=1690606 RepID=A0AAV9NEA7_9EURO|nr:hypothetical protein LTR84_001863 [Exophiala bonariae]
MQFFTALILALPTLGLAQLSNNNLGSRPVQRGVITSAQALQAINAAAAHASNISVAESIAIVDPSGNLVAYLRQDNSWPAAFDIATKKARTVAGFNGAFTSAGLYNGTQPGGAFWGLENTNSGLVVFAGGTPIFVGDRFIGAIGVSGGSVDQDAAIAEAGAKAIGTTA